MGGLVQTGCRRTKATPPGEQGGLLLHYNIPQKCSCSREFPHSRSPSVLSLLPGGQACTRALLTPSHTEMDLCHSFTVMAPHEPAQAGQGCWDGLFTGR